MTVAVSRLPLARLLKRTWMLSAYQQAPQRDCHPTPATRLMPELKVDFLPELPLAPPYPCPFLTAMDMDTYMLPLYRFGWGVSCVPVNASGTKPTPPATRLSKRIILPKHVMAGILMKAVTSTVIEPENHHPTLEQQSQGALSVMDIHVHTHTARAPPDRQNIDDQESFIRKRPGITHRDIRFAILVERLLVDSGLSPTSFFYPQPTDIDSVHNFQALPPDVRDSTR